MHEESLEVASCYFALGVLCKQQGMYAEAFTHYERSLAIRLKVHGTEDHPMSREQIAIFHIFAI